MSLALAGVSYRYAGAPRPALRDVSLELQPGQVLGLVGPSEAGKTTVCLVASGLAPRTVGGTLGGQVLLDGADTAPLAMHELGGQVGMAFANPGTQLTGVAASVFEEVAFGPMNLGYERDDVIQRTWRALEALRIPHLAERDPARLSGGQQQLVAVAGLLALSPAHLVLDEPTAQLDPAGTRLVADALARLVADGASILITEQKTDLLAGLCDRVAVIKNGQIIEEGPAGRILAGPELRELGVAVPAAVGVMTAARDAAVPRGRLAELERALHA
jgi:energy-coupling factor transporter ATP-binding protein EcfA2